MTRRTTRAVLAGGVLAAVLAVPAPAFANPSATDDAYAMYAGGTYTVDPVANDRSVLSLPPTTGPLTLCGLSGIDEQLVYVEQSDDSLVVEVSDRFQGTTSFSYEVCQGNRRASGTVTLTVTRLADLRAVKKARSRGKVVFTNPNRVPVRVSYGSAKTGRADSARTVPARSSVTVTTARTSLYWVGVYADGDVIILVGDDTVEGLQARKRR